MLDVAIGSYSAIQSFSKLAAGTGFSLLAGGAQRLDESGHESTAAPCIPGHGSRTIPNQQGTFGTGQQFAGLTGLLVEWQRLGRIGWSTPFEQVFVRAD